MRQYMGCDGHKKYSIFGSINEAGRYGPQVRVNHQREISGLF